jgi:hypothetical protein
MWTRTLSAWALARQLRADDVARMTLDLLDAIDDGRARGRLLPEEIQVGRDEELALYDVVSIPEGIGAPSTIENVVEIVEYLTRWQPPRWLRAIAGARSADDARDRLLGELPEELALRPVTARFYGQSPLELDGVVWFPIGGQPRPVAIDLLAGMRWRRPPSPGGEKGSRRLLAKLVARKLGLGWDDEDSAILVRAGERVVAVIPAESLPLATSVEWVASIAALVHRMDDERLIEWRHVDTSARELRAR